MYIKNSRNIQVTVHTTYVRDQSRPRQKYYVWSYQIEIKNYGQKTVQLLNRHWKIINSVGQLHEVFGSGVIGQQPVLKPGALFQYSSYTVLNTPEGKMAGFYQMLAETGELFNVEIPEFKLLFPCRLVSEPQEQLLQ